jgi:hypothetical protein
MALPQAPARRRSTKCLPGGSKVYLREGPKPEPSTKKGRPPNKPTAASGPGGRWGSVVFGWRALRPPRVVFVIGCVLDKISYLSPGVR